jgi:hypothetical protein
MVLKVALAPDAANRKQHRENTVGAGLKHALPNPFSASILIFRIHAIIHLKNNLPWISSMQRRTATSSLTP